MTTHVINGTRSCDELASSQIVTYDGSQQIRMSLRHKTVTDSKNEPTDSFPQTARARLHSAVNPCHEKKGPTETHLC